MSRYTHDDFVEAFRSYLEGEIDQEALYYWNCGFLKEKQDDDLLQRAWAVAHQIHERDPDSKTTDEEIAYLLGCLKGIHTYSDEALQQARDEGMQKRFARIRSYN